MNRWWLLGLLWLAAQCGAETLSHGRFQNIAKIGLSPFTPEIRLLHSEMFGSGSTGSETMF